MLLFSAVAVAVVGATDVSVAIPEFACGPELPANKCGFFAEYLGDRLTAAGGLAITTPAQVVAALGVERQRQLLGCSETSCVAELVGAMGSEALVVSTVARVGEEFAITVKVVDAKNGKVIGSHSSRAKKEEALLDFLSEASRSIHDEVLMSLRQVTPAAPSSSRFTPRVLIPAALGVASLVASGVLFGVAHGTEDRLRNGDASISSSASAHQVALDGAGQQVASGVLLGVGLVSVGVAVVLYLLEPHAHPLAWFERGGLPLAWSWSQP